MAVFRIERTLDYTVMSNHHLKDTALSLKAKGLLSMMLSLPDEWNYTTRGLAAICKEGVDAIGGALRELEKAGYIVRRQLRGPGGRISDTEYTIYEKPCPGAEEPPEEPGPDTTPPDTGAPDTAFPYLVEPDMVEPSTEKPAELNTKRSNIQKSNTHLSNTHSFVLSTPELEGMKDVYEKREEIREQIEYDLICTPVNRTQVDEFVELMLEVAMTRSPTIKIDLPQALSALTVISCSPKVSSTRWLLSETDSATSRARINSAASRWTEYWHLNCSKIPLVFGNFPSTSRAEKSKVPLQNTRLFPVTPIS